jgi:hypothetical protein
MNRRTLVTVVLAIIFVTPLVLPAWSQHAGKPRRVGVMFWESSSALQDICTRNLQSRESMVAPPWMRYPLYRTMSNIAIFEPGSNSGEGSWSFVINRVFLPALFKNGSLSLWGSFSKYICVTSRS